MCGEKRQELARPIAFPETVRFDWVRLSNKKKDD